MSWTESSSGTSSWNTICSSSDGNTMYAGTNTEIFKSVDKGISWISVLTTIASVRQVCCNKSGSNILATTGDSTKYSTNSGTSFNSSLFNGAATKTIAMTDNSTPRLFQAIDGSATYQSTNNISWSLFVSSSAGPFKSIACGNTVTSTVGYIYLNSGNISVYTSQNGGTNNMSPFHRNL